MRCSSLPKTTNFMNIQELEDIISMEPGNYDNTKASEFENIICTKLHNFGRVKRQVLVENRGDGRRGRIDLVFYSKGEAIPIEIDRKVPRKKSIFKVVSFNPGNAFCITRSPFKIYKF